MKSKELFCLLSNDVETTSLWHNCLRDETGIKVFQEGMPLLLDLYQKFNIKTTFFFTGYIAKLIPEIVKMVLPFGHEVGSHGLSHQKQHGFDVMPLKDQISHLAESKKVLEDITGSEIISFRAPALRVNSDTPIALKECDFKIDSSIASQRFDFFMSFGGVQKLNWLWSPRLPYITSSDNLYKKGTDGLIEIPVSATLMPYISTTMRIFPYLTAFQRNILAWESKISGKPIVFITHPNEFIDESLEVRQFSIRTKGIVASFLQDVLRSNLKLKNLGRNGINIFENEINHISSKNFQFMSIKEYCSHVGLLSV